MSLPTTPEGWAIHLSQLVKVFHNTHGLDRFPINVADIAMEYSRQVFPEEPISRIESLEMSERFEGMLIPIPDRSGEWGIVYNSAITSKGRINFTLAHELGHYLLHRTLSPEGMRCGARAMLDWKSEHGQIEAEANTFASYLLMPLDDFRDQIKGEEVSLALMRHLSDRYEVSLTAAILKWLAITDKRAMIVIGKDGFIDWAWSSKPLLKSGVFYRARQEVVALPEKSLAARRDPSVDNITGVVHACGVWLGDETVHEMTVLSKDGNSSISLLIYPDRESPGQPGYDSEELEDLDTLDLIVPVFRC